MKHGLKRFVMSVVVLFATVSSVVAHEAPATPTASPEADASWNTDAVGGNGFDVLLPAPEGTVAVIAMGEYDGTGLPVIVHNNTGTAIDEMSVDVVVRDNAGKLFALGSSNTLVHNPGRLEPQDVGFGMVAFPVTALPEGATMETQVHYQEAGSLGTFGSLPAEVVDWRQRDTLVAGVLANPNRELTMTEPLDIQVACLSADGRILSLTDGDSEDDEIAPGGEIRFSATLPGSACDHILIIASGNNFN